MTNTTPILKKWKLTGLFLISLMFFLYTLAFTSTYDEFFLNLKISYKMSSLKEISSEEIFVPTRDKWKITIHCNSGRLGNQMGTYATLIGLAYLNNLTPISKTCNLSQLKKYFKLSTDSITDEEADTFSTRKIGSFLSSKDYHLPNYHIHLKGYLYPLSFTFFDHVKPVLKKEFTFLPLYHNFAQKFLHEQKQNTAEPTYVGIHVRRTDYISHQLKFFRAKMIDMEYFNKAMDYFRLKYKNVIFVAVSDDKTWLQQNFKFNDTVISPDEPDPGYDMALLSQCNHTIMSYGSFGFWGAYLSGGETVYYADYIHPNSSYLRKEMPYNVTYLPSWKGISTTPPNFWNSFNASMNHF